MRIEDEIKQYSFIDAHQKVLINLLYTTGWLQSKQQSFFKPYGITSQQFNILRILKGAHPKAMSGTEIKARMLDKNSDISRLLDRLIVKKLVVKSISQNDKRASEVKITTPGITLLQDISKSRVALDQVLALTAAEANQLSDLLDKARG